ncbi:MAG: T9SS type A sorting domain-containing protein [Bacteroidia bacterium]|nr:T9SS type A sorting domain-containing protein [Bacteroidia bacterium]
MGLIDFDGDGDLDLFIEDHEYGIDLLINDGTGTFTHYTTDASPRGFGTTGASGDYSLVADMNNDGYVDIVARREGQSNNVNQIDVFFNNGNGTFSGNSNVNLNALNSNKGGVVAADLDADGDLDYFWTDNGTSASPGNNYIIEQTGINSGTFALATVTVTGSSSSLPTSGLIDGVAAGDVNNDGKIDLFLTANSGTSFLLISNSPGPGVFSFDHTNYGINVNADGEGCEFVDFDNDGDLDLYVNVNNGHNQMWQNNLSDSNYMHINALIDLGGGLTRPAVGATVLLRDCHGNRMTPIMEVNGGSGHGTQGAQELHFGLPAGINNVYYVEVSFVRPNGGSRTIVSKQIYPAMLVDNTFTVKNSDPDDPVDCFILPVKLISFAAKVFNKTVDLNWRIEEQGLRFTAIERSATGNNFELIGGVSVSGRSDYSFTDKTPATGINYYRLKFTESNGQTSYSKTITAEIHTPAVALKSIKPNPFMDRIEATVNLERTGTIILDLIETTGKRIIHKMYEGVQGANTIVLTDLFRLQKGVYILRINTGEITESIKLVKQ